MDRKRKREGKRCASLELLLFIKLVCWRLGVEGGSRKSLREIQGYVGVFWEWETLIGNGIALVCREIVPFAELRKCLCCWGDAPIFLEG